jgi:hypothetical protein
VFPSWLHSDSFMPVHWLYSHVLWQVENMVLRGLTLFIFHFLASG